MDFKVAVAAPADVSAAVEVWRAANTARGLPPTVQRVQRVVEKTADTLPDRRYPLFCVGGVDINKPRTRAALSAVLALAVSQDGFTVADLATKVQSLTGQSKDDYTVRQAAYDLRGKRLVVKPGRTRRYHVPGQAARTIAALLTLRDQVIAPILDAGQ